MHHSPLPSLHAQKARKARKQKKKLSQGGFEPPASRVGAPQRDDLTTNRQGRDNDRQTITEYRDGRAHGSFTEPKWRRGAQYVPRERIVPMAAISR